MVWIRLDDSGCPKHKVNLVGTEADEEAVQPQWLEGAKSAEKQEDHTKEKNKCSKKLNDKSPRDTSRRLENQNKSKELKTPQKRTAIQKVPYQKNH